MKTILKCKFTCDFCGEEECGECLPYGWYSMPSKVTGFEFSLCRNCIDTVHIHLQDTIDDFPISKDNRILNKKEGFGL